MEKIKELPVVKRPAGNRASEPVARAKKSKLPKKYSVAAFAARADETPNYEEWARVGDVFFGIKLHHEDVDDDDPEISFFITTSNIPASEAPSVPQEFWEKQLLYNLRRIENAKRSS